MGQVSSAPLLREAIKHSWSVSTRGRDFVIYWCDLSTTLGHAVVHGVLKTPYSIVRPCLQKLNLLVTKKALGRSDQSSDRREAWGSRRNTHAIRCVLLANATVKSIYSSAGTFMRQQLKGGFHGGDQRGHNVAMQQDRSSYRWRLLERNSELRLVLLETSPFAFLIAMHQLLLEIADKEDH